MTFSKASSIMIGKFDELKEIYTVLRGFIICTSYNKIQMKHMMFPHWHTHAITHTYQHYSICLTSNFQHQLKRPPAWMYLRRITTRRDKMKLYAGKFERYINCVYICETFNSPKKLFVFCTFSKMLGSKRSWAKTSLSLGGDMARSIKPNVRMSWTK